MSNDAAFPLHPPFLGKGMSKREYIATALMKGVITMPLHGAEAGMPIAKLRQAYALEAVALADALLEALK